MRPEHWLFTIPLRLRSLFRWAQADQELDDELRDHLERKTEEYLAQGMTQEEARRRARLDLGGVVKVKEECRDYADNRKKKTIQAYGFADDVRRAAKSSLPVRVAQHSYRLRSRPIIRRTADVRIKSGWA